MSFSFAVKNEISNAPSGDRHCRIAMLAAMINGAAKVSGPPGAVPEITMKTENPFLAKRFYGIVKNDFSAVIKVVKRETSAGLVYEFYVEKPTDAARILHATGLWDESHGYVRRINTLVTRSDCCRRAYLSGTLLACGYLSNPDKAYHCEFIAGDKAYAEELSKLWESFGLTPRSIRRRSSQGLVVYFKDSEQIADILNITGAHASLMQFEDACIMKDVGNRINRSVNCDSANTDKAIQAAVKQIESINLIKSAGMLYALPESLAEIAVKRLEHPEISLAELGMKLSPPVGKSGVNHRLRKIRDIADRIQEAGK